MHQAEKREIPNTFGIKAFATDFKEYHSEDELLGWILAGELRKPCLHIGQGSNLLFLKDYEGTLLHSCINGVQLLSEDEKEVHVCVGAGMLWDDFVAYCVERAWYGAENLSLIPGEVGAAAVQNIGAYGVEVKDLILSVETVDFFGKKRTYRVGECCYSYRDSLFKRPEMKSVFVTRVCFRLSKKPSFKLDYGAIRQELARYPSVNLETVRRVIIGIRKSKLPDPALLGNAGSFFMNPVVPRCTYEELRLRYPDMPCYEVDEERVKIPAGWMIDRCGWKGKALGRAAVHDRQALVLLNLGGATGGDIVALSDAVRASVRAQFGIDLHPEVNFIG